MDDLTFIEKQFPVSKISKESYKERKAVQGQTLTGLGKWWGRKPLILVRATLLGLLMPSSDDPKKDREIFLKILTMDDKGLELRKDKPIPASEIYTYLTLNEKNRYFTQEEGKIQYIKGLSNEERQKVQSLAFKRMSYDEKLKYCKRPEEVEIKDKSEWDIINGHLKTNAYSLQELIKQLGEKRFGKVPTVGDCFSGGGSIPFEAARMGFDVYASDLNPIAMLLTWASLNILGSSKEEIEKLKEFQERVYNKTDKIITEWGIEHNEKGHRANAYLYCNEIICPECGYKVPLSSTWIIGRDKNSIAILKDNGYDGFDIKIKMNATSYEMKKAEKGTVIDNKLVCPHCSMETPITAIRKDRRLEDGTIVYGLRRWERHEFLPREDDVFKERLYCIRYEDEDGNRYYTAPTKDDLKREEKVIVLLKERFEKWQEKGYIPSSLIEEGDKTDEPIRTRGWAYWHQLFNPRQLLIHGLLMEIIDKEAKSNNEKIIGLLSLNKCANWSSKLSRWDNGGSPSVKDTYYNQALNTLFNYSCRALNLYKSIWFFQYDSYFINKNINKKIELNDARNNNYTSIFWFTDPPYADAINYHELSEFFLAWDKKMLLDIFPDWYADSKRALAVKGTGEDFNQSMIDIYKNLAEHMADNGMQVVMFTHQLVSVWADLTLILWASGLKVTAAWTIATETDSGGLKDGNYIKGTVLLILRKQLSDTTAFTDELYPEIEFEVKRQIDSMRELDDKDDPNFNDADYILAAYAAAIRVLTSYKKIEDINIEYELSKKGQKGYVSPIENIINEAVKIAYDYLTPAGFDSFTWKTLTAQERFYIKGLDLEKSGVNQLSAYQEIAKGFGVNEYKDLLQSTKANSARLKTAIEFGMKNISSGDNFSKSLLRNIFAALHQSIKEENTMQGRNWLKNELLNYWSQRNTIISILEFIATFEHIENMKHWEQEAKYAKLLIELIRHDGV